MNKANLKLFLKNWWRWRKVNDMTNFFKDCKELKDIPSTEECRDVSSMFRNAESLSAK